MELPVKIFFFICFLIQPLYSKEIELPHYSIFTNGQFKCDDSGWRNLPWDKRYHYLWQLAYKSVSIVGNVELKEVFNRPRKKKDERKYRAFDLNYTAYAQLACGKEIEVKIEKSNKGIPIKESWYITTAWQRDNFLDIESDDDPDSDKFYMYFSLTPFGGDEPKLNRKGLEGLTCLVDINDFIKNPFSKIDLKRLCEGEKKNKTEQVKKEILRIADTLKKAQSPTLSKDKK
jgi:hypothetical protein